MKIRKIFSVIYISLCSPNFINFVGSPINENEESCAKPEESFDQEDCAFLNFCMLLIVTTISAGVAMATVQRKAANNLIKATYLLDPSHTYVIVWNYLYFQNVMMIIEVLLGKFIKTMIWLKYPQFYADFNSWLVLLLLGVVGVRSICNYVVYCFLKELKAEINNFWVT